MLKTIIKTSLKEDIGKGDISANSLIPENKKVRARIIAKEKAIVCGIDAVKQVFKALDRGAGFKVICKDGQKINRNKTILIIQAKARAIVSGERVALNFLSHLSGIATQTTAFAAKTKPYKTKILDTRKTLPGLRELEKYAVKCGGGFNHRFGLSDMVLIKDNHKKALGKSYKIQNLIELARQKNKNKKIEIEVESLREFKQALCARPDIIMLDNMSLQEIKQAVKFLNSFPAKTKIKLEVSGNVNLNNVNPIARTGVDFISVGALTHSSKAVDMSLEII